MTWQRVFNNPADSGLSEKLKAIRVLWRQPDTLALWGIPYEMRPGQEPINLWRARQEYVAPRPGHYGAKQIELNWVWLGSPGWWGSLSTDERREVETFLAKHKDYIPKGPGEWDVLP